MDVGRRTQRVLMPWLMRRTLHTLPSQVELRAEWLRVRRRWRSLRGSVTHEPATSEAIARVCALAVIQLKVNVHCLRYRRLS
eukprot:2410961-Prymnesium_polylepis.1